MMQSFFHRLSLIAVPFVVYFGGFIALIAAAEPINVNPTPFSANPTLEEVLDGLQDGQSRKFASMTPQNAADVRAILRRIATRTGDDVNRLIEPVDQATASGKALDALGWTAQSPEELSFFPKFFEAIGDSTPQGLPEPYPGSLVTLGEGIANERRGFYIREIASAAMEGYAATARRLRMDDVAASALLRKLDDSDYKISSGASRAMEELQSFSVVAAIERRMREAEQTFPRDAWDQQYVDDLDEKGIPDRRFNKARIYLSVLGTMKTAEARAAAWAALSRWEAIYRNHPDRDKYLEYLGVPHWRDDQLPRTANEIETSKSHPAFPSKEAIETPTGLSSPRASTLPSVIDANRPGGGPSSSVSRTWLEFTTAAALLLLAGLLWWRAKR